MKKVNFKKLTNQFLAGVFGLALMGGVMLHTQDVEAQEYLAYVPQIVVESGNDSGCKAEQISCGWFSGNRMICHVNGNGVSCSCGDSTQCGD